MFQEELRQIPDIRFRNIIYFLDSFSFLLLEIRIEM